MLPIPLKRLTDGQRRRFVTDCCHISHRTQRHPPVAGRHLGSCYFRFTRRLAVPSTAWHVTRTHNQGSIAFLEFLCDHMPGDVWSFVIVRACRTALIPAILRQELDCEKPFFLETMPAGGEKAVEPVVGDGGCNWRYASLAAWQRCNDGRWSDIWWR